MFLMRRATTEDVSTLLKLAKMVHFINLPADKDIIADKANWSAECFAKAAGVPPRSAWRLGSAEHHAERGGTQIGAGRGNARELRINAQ
jgi:arginine/ornithine N-succinyltransferase beta subunit